MGFRASDRLLVTGHAPFMIKSASPSKRETASQTAEIAPAIIIAFENGGASSQDAYLITAQPHSNTAVMAPPEVMRIVNHYSGKFITPE